MTSLSISQHPQLWMTSSVSVLLFVAFHVLPHDARNLDDKYLKMPKMVTEHHCYNTGWFDILLQTVHLFRSQRKYSLWNISVKVSITSHCISYGLISHMLLTSVKKKALLTLSVTNFVMCEFYPNFTYVPIFPKKSKTSLILLMLFFQLQMISFRPILALTLPSTPDGIHNNNSLHFFDYIFFVNDKTKLQQRTVEHHMKLDFTQSVFSLQCWKIAKWLHSPRNTFNVKMLWISEINLIILIQFKYLFVNVKYTFKAKYT